MMKLEEKERELELEKKTEIWNDSKLKVGIERKIGFLSRVMQVNRVFLPCIMHQWSTRIKEGA